MNQGDLTGAWTVFIPLKRADESAKGGPVRSQSGQP